MTDLYKLYARRIRERAQSEQQARDALTVQNARRERERSIARTMIFFFFAAITFALLTLALWPFLTMLIEDFDDVAVVVPLGKVQGIRFVGGLVPSTEVQTEAHTVLLRGAMELGMGEVVSRRVGNLGMNELCVEATKKCFEVMSR